MTDALLPAVRKSMPGKSCVLRKRFALLSLLRVAQTVPSRLVLPLSGSRSASRKTPCQRADNQSICWTLGTSAPTLSFLPQDLLDTADCIVVFPSVLKAAFIVGASYGRGAMSCRKGENFRGPWGAPTMMALEGGSFGLQLGGEATDFVLLVMNERGARGILASKVKLGGDASVAAGPVGRDASADTHATLRAQILIYSRPLRLFAGLSLQGSTIRPDNG